MARKSPDAETCATPVVAYLGLGSNLGDRLAYLRQAVLLLDSGGNAVADDSASADPAVPADPATCPVPPRDRKVDPRLCVTAVSPVYETEPIGGPEQGAYLNIVAQIRTSHSPEDLLRRCLEVERLANRIRKERWGPRTLDIDILWMDGISVSQDNLTIPHPRMRQRRFVMIPLGDLAPEFLTDWDDPRDGDITRKTELFDTAWPGDRPAAAQ